jgi:hypothetical protein
LKWLGESGGQTNEKAPFSATRKTKVGIDSVSQPRASNEHPKRVAKLVAKTNGKSPIPATRKPKTTTIIYRG